MSSARCCCDAGPYTEVVRCGCTPGSNDPTFIENYDPALGCVYLKDPSDDCWYAGPESPSKDTLDPGDVSLGSPTLTQVDTADLACCLCCECGGSNATPVSCFDTPPGGCECCPEDGDGTEWIWTWQTSWQDREQGDLSEQLNGSGTMHYKDSGSTNCAKVLSIDATTNYWAYDLFGALICERHDVLTDCSDLESVFWQDVNWGSAPCGERLIPDQWRLPSATWGGNASCNLLYLVKGVGYDPFDTNHWNGTSSCTWTGTSYTAGNRRYDTSGALFFSGDCHRSRIVWNFTVRVYSLPDETLLRTLTAQGELELQVVAPSCPGGCGHRARFFGLNAIPAGGGGGASPLVLRSLEGMVG